MSKPPKEKSLNIPSSSLSKQENELLFSFLTYKCVTQNTSVVQVYVTKPPAHFMWVKKGTGALCYEKDSPKRSYFLRLYCLKTHKLLWEQEMYRGISFKLAKPFLVMFVGDFGNVSLNFTSINEASSFYDHVSNSKVAKTVKNTIVEPIICKESKKGQSKCKPKFSKDDIGEPQDFRHVGHVGFGEEFDKQSFLDAGLTEDDLAKHEKFIVKYMKKHDLHLPPKPTIVSRPLPAIPGELSQRPLSKRTLPELPTNRPLPEPPFQSRPLPQPPSQSRPLPEPPSQSRPLPAPPSQSRPLPAPPSQSWPLPEPPTQFRPSRLTWKPSGDTDRSTSRSKIYQDSKSSLPERLTSIPAAQPIVIPQADKPKAPRRPSSKQEAINPPPPPPPPLIYSRNEPMDGNVIVESKPVPISNPKQDLFAQIKEKPTLKSVAERIVPERRPSNDTDVLGALKKIIAQRNAVMRSSDDDEDYPNNDGNDEDEWSD